MIMGSWIKLTKMQSISVNIQMVKVSMTNTTFGQTIPKAIRLIMLVAMIVSLTKDDEN